MSRFEKFKKKHGKPADCETVTPKQIESFKGKLPEALLDEWSENGWCSYGGGLFWTVNPEDFEDVLEDWVDDDAGKYVYLRTAFGSMIFWDGERNYFVDVLHKDVSQIFNEVESVFDTTLCTKDFLEYVVLQKTFKAALPKLGKMKKDECYGFLPPIAISDDDSPDALELVKLREHLAILAQV